MNKVFSKTVKIKDLLLEKEIHVCLICDNICAFSALEEGLSVIFHVCFNCVTFLGI